jgi:ABC-type glycerol-3-phosphate transport system permease component
MMKSRIHPLVIIIAFLYTLIVLVPFIWLIFQSFKPNLDIFGGPFTVPESLAWDNYVRAWTEADVGQFFLNSVVVTVVSVFLIILLSAMATNAISRLRFKFNAAVLYAFILGLLIPRALVLGPLYLLLQNIGMIDTFLGLILVYIAFSFPFSVFVLTPFFNSVPEELEEASFLDGASHYTVFWRVMLPLVKPGLAIVTIFNILGIWNEYILAYTIIASDRIKTLPLGLAELARAQQYETDWAALFAALVIVIIPIFLAYLAFQRSLQSGIMGGALK